MKKRNEPPMLFSPAERQACLADIVKFILARRKLRLEQAHVQEGKVDENGNPDEGK